MPAVHLPLLATVILLFPMFYFAMASLTFFLRRFDDPIVTWMLRGLFDVYFLAVIVFGTLAMVAFGSDRRLLPALCFGALAACGIGARQWFLGRLDGQIRARDIGQPAAIRRLRRLHVGGILYNACQCVAVTASVPHLFTELT